MSRFRPAVVLLAMVFAPRPAAADESFESFMARFRPALAGPDLAAIAGQTRLPFLFEGRWHEREAFLRIAPGLLTPPVRRCLASGAALAEDGARVVFCKPYAFYFRRGPDGRYRLEEFAADGEAR